MKLASYNTDSFIGVHSHLVKKDHLFKTLFYSMTGSVQTFSQDGNDVFRHLSAS